MLKRCGLFLLKVLVILGFIGYFVFRTFKYSQDSSSDQMRIPYKIQQSLGTIPIGEVSISRKSRHELPPILVGLQYVFLTDSLREPILEIVEADVVGNKARTGRPGMSLWEILVMGVVRLGLDADYDQLEDLANNHKSFRGILGVEVENGFGDSKHYGIQTLKDNVSLLDEASINRINELILTAGHTIVKKKRRRNPSSSK